MEVGYTFSLTFEDIGMSYPFGIGFLNRSQGEMVRSVETEFRNLTNNETNNININSPEAEERLSNLSTEGFKQRLRELLEEFLSYVQFRVSIIRQERSEPKTLSKKEYTECIARHKGSYKLAKSLGCCKERVCSICLEELKYNRIWHSPKCGHMFHPKCLQTYLTKKCIKPTCPICRENVKTTP
tara:strand:+ start:14125 stop:14676 length:552 start_codon:yes stop_codon:yes gene_type:complete